MPRATTFGSICRNKRPVLKTRPKEPRSPERNPPYDSTGKFTDAYVLDVDASRTHQRRPISDMIGAHPTGPHQHRIGSHPSIGLIEQDNLGVQCDIEVIARRFASGSSTRPTWPPNSERYKWRWWHWPHRLASGYRRYRSRWSSSAGPMWPFRVCSSFSFLLEGRRHALGRIGNGSDPVHVNAEAADQLSSYSKTIRMWRPLILLHERRKVKKIKIQQH